MSNSVQAAVDQFIIDTIKDAESVKAFFVAETPGLINDLLAWNLLAYSMYLVIWTASNAALFLYLYKRKFSLRGFDDDFMPFMLVMIVVFWSIVGGIVAVALAFEALQIVLYPKVWLLDYIRGL